MLILTLDNKTFDLSKMPNEVEDDIRFSVLDNNVLIAQQWSCE